MSPSQDQAVSRKFASSPSVPVSGFTLVELLAVALVIVVLAGLIIGAAVWAQRRSLDSRARADLKLLEMGIESFKADQGYYPTSTLVRSSYDYLNEQGNSAALYAQLVPNYLNPPDHMVKSYTYYSVTYTFFVDPFDLPYNYYNPPTNAVSPVKVNQTTYDLLSYGPDRVTFVGTGATNDTWYWKFGGLIDTQAGWGDGSERSSTSAIDDITNYN